VAASRCCLPVLPFIAATGTADFVQEDSIRKATAEFVSHYHVERNHQGLGNRLITPEAETLVSKGEIERRERLGGLLNRYYRRAA
jgi:hypothetical protein